MKRIATFVSILPCTFIAFSATTEVTSGISFSIPVDESNCMIRNISTIKYNMGIRLNLGPNTITGNCKLDSKIIINLYGYTPIDYVHSQDYTYGIQHTEKLNKLKFDFLAGTLRFSNAITRLKNPSITCPAPLRKGSFLAPGIAPSLPGSTSNNTPVSFAAILTPAKDILLLPVIQIAILETDEKYGAIYKKLSTSLVPDLIIAFSGGTFFHHYENESSWYQNKRYYRESDFFSSELLISTAWKNLKNSASVGIYENPFGGTRRWIRNQTYLTMGVFSLGLYIFDSDSDVITASGNFPKIGRQFFISPQLRFYAGKGTLNLGTTFGETQRKSKERVSRELRQYYMKSAITFTGREFSLGWKMNLDFANDKMQLNKSWGLTAAFPFLSTKSETTFNCTYGTEDTKSYKISQKFFLKKGMMESFISNWTIKETTGNESWNFDLSANFANNSRRIKMKGKVSFSFRKIS